MSSIAGELITERLEFDGGRHGVRPAGRAEAIVFAGDGHLVSQWRVQLTYRQRSSSVSTGCPMRRCGSMSTRRALSRSGSRHTRSSSSRTYVAGASALRSRHARRTDSGVRCLGGWGSWPSLRGFGIPMSTARSSAPLLAAVTGRLALCRARFRARTSSPALWSRSSRQRHPMGDRASGCRRRCHDRARRIARREVLARRAAADGGVGVWTMKRHDASPASHS